MIGCNYLLSREDNVIGAEILDLKDKLTFDKDEFTENTLWVSNSTISEGNVFSNNDIKWITNSTSSYEYGEESYSFFLFHILLCVSNLFVGFLIGYLFRFLQTSCRRWRDRRNLQRRHGGIVRNQPMMNVVEYER